MIKTWGNIVCVIDTETTGLDPKLHEIVEICVLPLDADLTPYPGVTPFHTYLKPTRMQNINDAALKVNKTNIVQLIERGIDPFDAADLFDDWYMQLPLQPGKRIIPLGHNYAFDRSFIYEWVGEKSYNDYFHYHYMDSMLSAQFINNRADFRLEVRPFDKISLTQVAYNLNIKQVDSHTAIGDCMTTMQCYKAMLTMFMAP
jgi:oligoribonuclease (3'-5' exoribonuclease)